MTAIKNDQNKPDFTQIPQEALLEVAKVLTFGAHKYKAFNYSNGMEHRRYVAAAHRHINQWLKGIDIDDESECHHIASAIASLMMCLDNIKTKKGTDDRNSVYKK